MEQTKFAVSKDAKYMALAGTFVKDFETIHFLYGVENKLCDILFEISITPELAGEDFDYLAFSEWTQVLYVISSSEDIFSGEIR